MKPRICLFSVLSILAFGWPAAADEKNKEEAEKIHPVTKAKNTLREKFQEIRKSSEKIEGLFDLYQDSRDGKVYLAIKPEQIGPEFIYFPYTKNGIVAASHFRGQFGAEKIFAIRRRFNEIDFVAANHAFYFDPKNALSRASDANISPAVLATATVIGEDRQSKAILVEADGIFLKEFFRQIKPSETKKEGSDEKFGLGALSAERTRFAKLNNYPENTALSVEYVFENLYPKAQPEEADVTDARFVSIEVQHTLIAVKESGYQPRFDDPRVGYFMTQVTDMTSTSNTPYRDLIHRWHLEPKEPAAAGASELVEPKQPITWWIENTTPLELRETIRDAVLGWNAAFETAGWKNAVAVEIQPDDAEWDAGDIRYNVLRWTSSPDVPFGGYGPSFVNPRTGEILGADIMLEFLFLTNRVKYRKIYTGEAAESENPFERAKCQCFFSDHLHQNNLVGRTALKVGGLGPIEVDELMKQGVIQLILHEVGHTLGLGHNFKASRLHDPQAIHDAKATETGLTASVMDYTPINIAPIGAKQGLWYDVKAGPYDHWAIEYGYSRALDDPEAEAEAKRLEAILSRSTEPGLDYANDADDMRSAGKAIDPRAMVGDMSSDPIGYAIQRMEIDRALLQQLLEKSPEPGRSFQTVADERSTLIRDYKGQLDVIARYVGGVEVERAVVGQPGATQPLKPVALAEQKRAMAALTKYAFAPDAFATEPELLAHLQLQRRGWDFKGEGEDPKLLKEFLDAQNSVLNHVLHQNTVTRVLNSELYGNEYALYAVLADLTDGIFKIEGIFDDQPNAIRQSLQRSYVDRLIKIAGLDSNSSYPQPAQARAFAQLTSLHASLGARPDSHLRHVAWIIGKALDETKE